MPYESLAERLDAPSLLRACIEHERIIDLIRCKR